MRTIWKYTLSPHHEGRLIIPAARELLSVQFQGNELCAWFLVDPDSDKTSWLYGVCGTGQQLLDRMVDHVATVQQGPLVWHVFERQP